MTSHAATAAKDSLVGTVLAGRYEIIARIGAGGMGRIYRAAQRSLDRLVALKVLNPSFASTGDPNFEERFFLEASMTARLRHANTVTIYDYGRSEGGLYFMALELLEGQTLKELLARGPISWPRALAIGAQVAGSLREAHRLGLVHRDLKPANIMLLEEGRLGDRVKLLDFGLVKHLAPLAAEGQETLTAAGVVLGSPLYMAPEQTRAATDLRGDLYALGAVLFSAIAGRPPFLGNGPLQLMLKHQREAPPLLSALISVPESVNTLVMKCLEKAPEDRFQNADELLLAIRKALNDEGCQRIARPVRSFCAGPAHPS
jgi:eukaryotic-like serine/threonine-protein kinase